MGAAAVFFPRKVDFGSTAARRLWDFVILIPTFHFVGEGFS